VRNKINTVIGKLNMYVPQFKLIPLRLRKEIEMSRHPISISIHLLFGFVLLLTPNPSNAECSLTHQECEYVCIEYYPNGTDCKKTRKECHTVCDDYDVDRGGVDDANRNISEPNNNNSE